MSFMAEKGMKQGGAVRPPAGELWEELGRKLNGQSRTRADMDNYRLLHLHFDAELSPRQQMRTCGGRAAVPCQQWGRTVAERGGGLYRRCTEVLWLLQTGGTLEAAVVCFFFTCRV